MVLISLSFCDWWVLWWLLPFLLGLLLGAIIWRKGRERLEELERQLATAKASTENHEYQLKKLKTEKEDADYQLQRAKSQNDEMTTTIARLKQQNAAKSSIAATGAAGAIATSKISKTPLEDKSNPSSDKLSTKAKEKVSETKASEDARSSDKSDSIYGDVKIPDSNLQIIEGIGPRMESILKENDITSWYDLTKKSSIELRAMLDNYGGRYSIVDPTDWPKQAKMAYKGKWEKLIKYQSEDGSKSKAETFLTKKK